MYLLHLSMGMLIFLPFLSFLEFVNRLFGYALQDKGRQECVGLVDVPDSYTGPRLQFPLTFTDLRLLIEAFKRQQASGSRLEK